MVVILVVTGLRDPEHVEPGLGQTIKVIRKFSKVLRREILLLTNSG